MLYFKSGITEIIFINAIEAVLATVIIFLMYEIINSLPLNLPQSKLDVDVQKCIFL